MQFLGVQAVYIKGYAPMNKLLIVECDKHIPSLYLAEFIWEKYLLSIHDPEDEVLYFPQWMPEKILDKRKCIRFPKVKILLLLIRKNTEIQAKV